MRIFSNLPLILLTVAISAHSSAETLSTCEAMARDVTVAIEKDMAKTLLVVEDALVINEGCAADIIKAAIIASRADPALVNQIVQAGISVAPKMAGVITDAASSIAPGVVIGSAEVGTGELTSGKNAEKNVLPALDKNPVVVDKNPVVVEQEEEFVEGSGGIRGVYLMQTMTSTSIIRKCDNVPTSPCGSTPKCYVKSPGGKPHGGKY